MTATLTKKLRAEILARIKKNVARDVAFQKKHKLGIYKTA